jgi:hypothetical protein
MATQKIDLTQLFGAVASTLMENKDSLNQSDAYNHDHGDNMVEIFQAITTAVQQKKNATPAEQLAYASKIVQSKSKSGSAKLYAEGLQNAATKFKSKKTITPNNGIALIQALMGTQSKVTPQALQSQAQSVSSENTGTNLLGSLLGGLTASSQKQAASEAGSDLLGSLLGGLSGSAETQSNQDTGTEMLGSLLGGLTGTTSGKTQSGKIDINQVLKAGMTYMAAKQSGSTGMEAILQAIMAGSKVGNQGYRAQSGTLVASSLLQALGQMSSK